MFRVKEVTGVMLRVAFVLIGLAVLFYLVQDVMGGLMQILP